MTTNTTRAEHLEWCKKRALEYCAIGDVNQAFASMGSDLGKHPETENHAAIELGVMMLMSGMLNTPREMEKFIKGFN
jgi:sulfite exporter TauE/SafE